MAKQVQVFYRGWGEHWLWGSLLESGASSGRPQISFEYSHEAVQRGLELSAYRLPLQGPRLRQNFPAHQYGLPGPVYDALPDGWGMLLMDRLFKRQGLDAIRIGALQRLCHIGDHAMGALSFQPVLHGDLAPQAVPLLQLAQQVTEVQQGEGGEFLLQLLQMGGSPQGARPKLLLYHPLDSSLFSNQPTAGADAWLVKFPARHEHAEVCALEKAYSHCLTLCGIDTPPSQYIPLPQGMAAFASRRFDRQGNIRIPMQTLAAFTGADYRIPGSLDYKGLIRATFACTQDHSQKRLAFERAVFNVAFNNRDDHPKNFSYLMDSKGHWQLAPAYDVTYCEGPAGYHQMDIMGEALDISQQALVKLGGEEADLSRQQAVEIVEKYCSVAARFHQIAADLLPDCITRATLNHIQSRIDRNLKSCGI